MAFSIIRNWISPDVGLDLGATTTRMYVRGRGVVLEMPSVVAVERKSGRVVAVGGKALSSVGPEVEIVHPFVGGVATNMDAVAGLMRFCFDIARPRQRWRRWLKPRVIIAEPLGFSEEERNAVLKIAERSGWGYTLVLNLAHAASIGP